MIRFALIWLITIHLAAAQIEIFPVSTNGSLQTFAKYYGINQKAIDKITESGCKLPANIIVTSKNNNDINAYILTQNNANLLLLASKKNGVQKISIQTTNKKYIQKYAASTYLSNEFKNASYLLSASEIFGKYAGIAAIKIKVLSGYTAFEGISLPSQDKAVLVEGQGFYMFMFFYAGQIYDKNGVLISNDTPSIPVKFARVSDFFTSGRLHPILNYLLPHQGIDLAAKSGAPVSSALDGVIEDVGYNPNIGNYVRIRHKNDYISVYGHLSKVRSDLKGGVEVRKMEPIGLVGQTGLATGPHLHFGVQKAGKYIDPAVFFATSWQKRADDNFSAFVAQTMYILTKTL